MKELNYTGNICVFEHLSICIYLRYLILKYSSECSTDRGITHTCVCVSGVKNYSFSGKFVVLYFLVTSVLRFALFAL